MNEILISGYYGFQNSGDDALLLAIINDIKHEYSNVGITVLSSNPEETSRIYGVKSINRLNIFKMIRAMLGAKLLISGGGTLIQDGTSSKSLWYYLTVISIAKRLGTKVMLYANGIGPIRYKQNAKHTKKVLNKVDLITLRDHVSKDELTRLGVTKPQIVVTADPAFTLVADEKSVGSDILQKAGVKQGRRLLCISVRRWKNLTVGFEESVARAADYINEKYGLLPVFLPMQLKKDYDISKRIASKMKSESVVLDNVHQTAQMLSVMSNMDLCIGMRLHTLIYAVSQTTPVIGLVYDPKISGFMDYMGQSDYINVEDANTQTLKNMIDSVMENYDIKKEQLKNNMSTLKDKAHYNAVLAMRLLKNENTTGKDCYLNGTE